MAPAHTAVWLVAGGLIAAAISPALSVDIEGTRSKLQHLGDDLRNQTQQENRLTEKELRVAQSLSDLVAKSIDLAAGIQVQEAEIAAILSKLEKLEAQETEAVTDLALREGQLGATMSALVRVARLRPQAMLFGPTDLNDTVRTSLILRNFVPDLEGRAGRLRDYLSGLRRLRAKVDAQRQALAKARTDQMVQYQEYERLIGAKKQALASVRGEVEAQRQTVARLAAEAADLKSLMAALESQEAELRKKRAAELQQQKQLAAKLQQQKQHAAILQQQKQQAAKLQRARLGPSANRMPLPSLGQVVAKFGDLGEAGVTQKGITIETNLGAIVLAPEKGVVKFAGTFKGYGELLIVALEGGYHLLLAGLARMDVAVGQEILPGEPVGRMAENDSAGQDGALPHLYMELRRNGEPINPLPWMAAGKRKVDG